MKDIRGKYTFVTAAGRVTIKCTLGYASWLVGTDRTHGGVFVAPPLRIYM